MSFIDDKVYEAMKSIVPDSKKSTSGTINICGRKCRYKRSVPTTKKNKENSIQIFKEIAFNGSGNAFEAVREAVILILNERI